MLPTGDYWPEHKMDHRKRAQDKLKAAKGAFDVAGAAYALLTSSETRDSILDYNVELNESGFHVGPRGGPSPQRGGVRRIVQWNGPVGEAGARLMLELMFQKLIIDCVDTVKDYSKAINQWDLIKRQDWFAMGMNLRNAFAHGGNWHFEKHAVVPVTYRNRSLTRDMHGQSAIGFLSYFDGQQLTSQMSLYVDGIVDHAQQHIHASPA